MSIERSPNPNAPVNFYLQSGPQRTFTLEITTTALCNLGCTYCFEGVKTDKRRLDDKVDLVIKRIEELYHSKFFTENYDMLNLSFWGGEPTLNHKFIIQIIQHCQQYKNIDFHLYTNGFNRKRLETIVDNVDLARLSVQISYDGKDTNDLFRLTLAGQPTSTQVVENVEYFALKGVRVSLKATIPIQSMKNMFKCWQDYKKIHDHLTVIAPNIHVAYAPTVDYYEGGKSEQLPAVVAEFRKQMLMIAAEEIKFYREHGRYLCSWFGSGDTKVHCASGANMHAIDVDGKTYACHGSLYSPNKEAMQGSSIESDTFVSDVEKMSKAYHIPIRDVSDVCKDCEATVCMICPVTSLDMSKKEDYFEKWTDRWVTNMCGFYKAFGEIDRTVQAHIANELPSRDHDKYSVSSV